MSSATTELKKVIESYRDNLISRILYHQKHPLKKVNTYTSSLSITEKKHLEIIAMDHIKLTVEKSEVMICVETHFESAEEHLESLIGQLKDDIFPLFRVKGNAPFTILRNTLSFCDYISRLHFGKKGSSGDLSRLFDSFGSYDYIKERYLEYKKYLIQLYRHEVIHTIRPWSKGMLLRKSGNLKFGNVGWNIKSKLPKEVEKKISKEKDKDKFDKLYSLLKEENNRKNLFHLRLSKKSNSPVINTYCFFFDLVDYLKNFIELVNSDADIERALLENLISVEVENYFNLLSTDTPIMDFDSNKIIR